MRAFLQLAQMERSAARGMLHHQVLPRGTTPAQKATALLASQLLTRPSGERPLVNIVMPPDGAQSAVIAATGLLVTDFLHQHLGGQRLSGNLLLVTHAITGSLEHLENLELEGSDIRFSQFWSVESFSRYHPVVDDRPHVIVANPGWITRLEALPSNIGAVIVDATHPRTFSRLGELERATRAAPLRIFLTPPLGERLLAELGNPAARLTWLWSPGPQQAVAEELRGPAPSTTAPQRRVYVCQDDPAFDRALAEVRGLLVTLMGLARSAPALLDAWSIYHRMRQLAVPLLQYEALARKGWGGLMLREQIDQLTGISLPNAALQGPWVQLTALLREAYDLLSQRQEPVKLYALTQRIETLLGEPGPPLIVVAPSRAETELLRRAVTLLIPGLDRHELSGQIEFLHAREEARRASAGQTWRSVLPGYRHGTLRYLDVYPTVAAESILYPHEVPLEQGLHHRSYAELEALEATDHLRSTLTCLGMTCPPGDLMTSSPRPELHIEGLDGQPIRLLQTVETQGLHLDMDELVSAELRRLDLEPGAPGIRPSPLQMSGGQVTVRYEDGEVQTLPEKRIVDVFYPDTGQLVRHCARDVAAGMHVVSMVDDAYSTLFERLVEVLDARSSRGHQIALQLWRHAKIILLDQYPSIRALERALQQDGLDVHYTTLRSWLTEFGNEPQSFSHMRLLALRSGLYPNEAMITHTYEAIQGVRNRNRSAGRALHAVLRAIATGEGYKAALNSSRQLDAHVSEVLAAVELRRVTQVTRLQPTASVA
ncbi:hypothetical protein [Deinococcus aquatilis]|uniref:hypothetical protein n=1 Tax=Deinococcus aquatilis TaxID=519440 RepID=UPI0012F9614F|nr:hypothetical protein [Deinococcus aquatilis]